MKEEDLEVIQGSLTMPLAKLNRSAAIKPPLIGFIKPKQGSTIEGWFEPKSYKLLANSGYDFKNPSQLGELYPEVTGEKIHGLNETQQRLRQKGYDVPISKAGLGFTAQEPIRVHL